MAAPLPDRVAIAGTFYRHLPQQGDPLWRADPARDGRWQRGRVVEGLYLADEPDTAWAEWYRGLAELALRPTTALPRDLWRFEVRVENVADLTSEEGLRSVGLEPPRPDRRTWPPYQDLGERLFATGYRGVVAPSAAREAYRTLCLFRVAPSIPGVTPLRPPENVRDPPPPPRGMRT